MFFQIQTRRVGKELFGTQGAIKDNGENYFPSSGPYFLKLIENTKVRSIS